MSKVSKWSKIVTWVSFLGHPISVHLQIGGGEEEEQLKQFARKDLSAPKDFFVSLILKNKMFKHYNYKNDFHLGQRSKAAEGAKSPKHHKQP